MMQISVFAIGRMKKGAAQELSQHYFDRLAKIAPSIGCNFISLKEMTESKALNCEQRKQQEGEKLLEMVTGTTALVLLDEKGKDFSSPQFADWLANKRDTGSKALLFALGGPDGHGNQVRARADFLWSLGRATWPHQIARILLAEQLYLAATILLDHPYHRS